MAVIAIAAGVLPGLSQQPDGVSFPTLDGGIVYADVYGAGDRGVVLAHGGRFTKESWAAQAPSLADAGFRVVAIDFRGRGNSRGGPESTAGDDGEQFDVLAAVRYLHQTGTSSVSIVGASFGGWAAALAALEAPDQIDRLVLLAHSSIDQPERLPGRTLFIVSRNDTTARGIPRLIDIRDQYRRAPGPKELVILEGSAHAQHVFESDEGERLLSEIIRFLSEL
jgi:pimeloyl-ACP methyl ester carboxylesterase